GARSPERAFGAPRPQGVPLQAVDSRQVGIALFGSYVLGTELASMLLLAGLVGAYHLGRREKSALGSRPGVDPSTSALGKADSPPRRAESREPRAGVKRP